MPRRTHPLELVLRAHGPAELVNANDETLWASDSDDDFREEFNNEFLTEEDLPDILEFLADEGILTEDEFDRFEDESWDCSVETLDQSDIDEHNEDEDEED